MTIKSAKAAENGQKLEIKALHDRQDVGQAFGEFMQAFESFKEANDERLTQIEKHMGTDVVTVEKVERLNRAMDEQKAALDQYVLKQARPALERGNQPHNNLAVQEHKQAFDQYARRGDEQTLRSLEQKAHSHGSGPDGGYLVPAELETEIGKRLAALSPVRSLATVRQVSGAVLKKTVFTQWPRYRLDWRGGRTSANDQCQTGRAAVPDNGNLCHASGHGQLAG